LNATENITEQLKKHPLIAILRGQYTPDEYLQIAEALGEAGFRFLEVTLNSSAPYAAIATLSEKFPDLLVGAGTVRTEVQAKQAVEHGASYLIAPGLRAAVANFATSAGVPHIPGVATPTEIEAAVELGCTLLKLYPASHLGGPAYLQAVAAPIDDVAFVPSGGVNLENVTAYLSAGAAGVGLGSSLLGRDVDVKAIGERARQFITKTEEIG